MKRLLPKLSLALYLAMFACLAGYGVLFLSGRTAALQTIPVSKDRGAYLAKLGDCTSCHTSQGHPDFAGGFKVNSPFGAIYGSNITPDPDAGIGKYTLEDFSRAIRQGVAKDGTHLYPAMPYTSYATLSDEDVAALYDYFMHEVKPSSYQPPKTHLSFPFNQRWGLWFWNLAFAKDQRFQPHADRDEAWNRGAYLVDSLGHCGACHSPRGPAFEETSQRSRAYLSGEILDNWYAANLTGNKASGLGQWSENDVASFLKTGHGNGSVAFGSMKEVIENSTQHLSDTDANAIAHYLKSLPAKQDGARYHENATKPFPFELPGAGIYASSCAGCHQPDGAGKPRVFPKLAGNGAVLSPDPASLIRIVLEGGRSPHTQTGPKPEKMPAFNNLTDREIAEVVSFIRQSWGNEAPSVSEREVSTLRRKIKE